MIKPRVKPGMATFTGCDVGEVRASVLISCLQNYPYDKLAREGYLNAIIEGNRVSYSLTIKGKNHLKPRETFYSQL